MSDDFTPDPKTGEPDVFTPEVVNALNKQLEAKMGEPIDLDNWPEDTPNLTHGPNGSATKVNQ